jgi:hypothetical protein
MSGLRGQFAARDVVAKGVFELALSVDRAGGKPVSILACAQNELAAAIQKSVFLDPKSVAPLPISQAIPL